VKDIPKEANDLREVQDPEAQENNNPKLTA